MTLRTPPSWLQNGSHPAENDRLTTQALWATTGIIKNDSLAVTQNSPAGLSVLVSSGWAAVVGTVQANMGTYVGYNDATVVLSVTTADPTNPRIDLVCLTVNDGYYTGVLNNAVLQVVAGTPAGSPVAPALPANSISLATVAVGAGATAITNANITDTRVLVTTNIPESGDISAVVAGTGLSGGGTSGSVTVSLDYKAATTLTVNAQTGTTYTTVAADAAAKLVTLTNASAITVTIAAGLYAVGEQINFSQMGAGQVTFQGDTGVTVVSTGATAATPKCRVQYSTATAICTASNTWLIVGDIA
jgi:hypothetical protein